MLLSRTEREQRVIDLYQQGKTIREIAQEVHMSFADIDCKYFEIYLKNYQCSETHLSQLTKQLTYLAATATQQFLAIFSFSKSIPECWSVRSFESFVNDWF